MGNQEFDTEIEAIEWSKRFKTDSYDVHPAAALASNEKEGISIADFDKMKWSVNTRVLYSGKEYSVASVDLQERLIGIPEYVD